MKTNNLPVSGGCSGDEDGGGEGQFPRIPNEIEIRIEMNSRL